MLLTGGGILFFFFFDEVKPKVWLTKSLGPTAARHCTFALSRSSCVKCNVLHEPKIGACCVSESILDNP
jgi:hypothetical protein